MPDDLLKALAAAECGSALLSIEVFRALGGELRTEVVSKQSGDERVFRFWPGDKDPCLDWQLTTNLNDIVAYVDRYHQDWTLHRIAAGRYAATIDAQQMFLAMTPALALCGAAVRSRCSR